MSMSKWNKMQSNFAEPADFKHFCLVLKQVLLIVFSLNLSNIAKKQILKRVLVKVSEV